MSRLIWIVPLATVVMGTGMVGPGVAVAGEPSTYAAATREKKAVAPSFSMRTLDGKTVRLSDFKGRPVVLDFWATWCAPCRASMPHLDSIQTRYKERGLVVLGLSVDDDDPPYVRKFADRLGVKFRLGMADEHILDLYGPIRSIPTTVFINRNGTIVRRVVGYLDQETVDAYVNELFVVP